MLDWIPSSTGGAVEIRDGKQARVSECEETIPPRLLSLVTEPLLLGRLSYIVDLTESAKTSTKWKAFGSQQKPPALQVRHLESFWAPRTECETILIRLISINSGSNYRGYSTSVRGATNRVLY